MRALNRKPTRLVLFGLLAVGVMSGGSPAFAHDHEPPRTALRANGETLQRGRLWSGCWTTRFADGTYARGCVDGFLNFPKVDVVRPGMQATIRIFKPQRPKALHINTWRRVDGFGMVVGNAEVLSYTRWRVRLADGVAWDFSFVVPDARRHYYLSVTGVWRDVDRVDWQDASWGFHVRTSR